MRRSMTAFLNKLTRVILWGSVIGALSLLAQPADSGGDALSTISADEDRSSGDSHQRMLELLHDIRDLSSRENEYTGDALHARERGQLEVLPADAPASHRARLHLIVGKDELRLGRNVSNDALRGFRRERRGRRTGT